MLPERPAFLLARRDDARCGTCAGRGRVPYDNSGATQKCGTCLGSGRPRLTASLLLLADALTPPKDADV